MGNRTTAKSQQQDRITPPLLAKGVGVGGSRRSPGSRVRMRAACVGTGTLARPCLIPHPILPRAFPEQAPVARCDVLAYSCAAARDLHPLPCPPHMRRTREPISKA